MTEHLEAQRELELALLRGAEDYLEAYGWCQGSLQSDEGKYCLVGALNASIQRYGREHGDAYLQHYYEFDYDQDAVPAAADVVVGAMETKYGCGSLIHWNDDKERTEADVMKLLADMIQERENTDEGS